MNKDTSIIPKGDYCYVFTGNRGTDKDGLPSMETCNCPYSTVKEYGGVLQPYCRFVEKGSLHKDTTEEEYEKLLKYFGSEEEMDEELSLFLLWDGIKECGANLYTEEEEELIFSEDEEDQKKFDRMEKEWKAYFIKKCSKLKNEDSISNAISN